MCAIYSRFVNTCEKSPPQTRATYVDRCYFPRFHGEGGGHVPEIAHFKTIRSRLARWTLINRRTRSHRARKAKDCGGDELRRRNRRGNGSRVAGRLTSFFGSRRGSRSQPSTPTVGYLNPLLAEPTLIKAMTGAEVHGDSLRRCEVC